jgi:flavin-dependent dehydrogenase
LDIDVAIIGAGPAGAAAGLALGGRARVLLIDRVAEPAPRIGESLIPAARRLLSDLGVLKAFEAEPHPPYLGNRSVWGGDWAETDFLRDPDGAGWHLDRVRFETFLRKAAGARGCRIIAPAKLETIAARGAGGWDIAVTDGRDRLEIEAKVVIDATGRAATVAKRLGAARKNSDRLTARWIRGQTSGETSRTAGFSTVESEAEGWWYTAPLADGTRVLAFHTDTDLMSETETVSADGLIARAMRCPAMAALLEETGFQADALGEIWTTAANTARTDPLAEADPSTQSGWLAVGDAGLSLDPLSSRGIFNALYTGVSGGMTAHRMLAGDAGAVPDHIAGLERIASGYEQHLALIYAAETRWPDQPFWQRRSAAA